MTVSGQGLVQMAEGQGFEPWMPLGMPVFKTGAFNRSATPPKGRNIRDPEDLVKMGVKMGRLRWG